MLRLLPLTLLLACASGENKLGTYNAEPTTAITSPPSGSSVDEGTAVTLTGLAKDNETGPDALVVRWSSNIDGVLAEGEPPAADGTTSVTTSTLSVGNHLIALDAWDEEGLTATSTVSLTVVDVPDAPTLTIVHPSNGETARDDVAFEMVLSVSDAQDAAEDLIVGISSDIAGTLCAPVPDSTGKATCSVTLAEGDHTLSFVVTDSSGLSASDTWLFSVQSHESIDDDLDGWTELQGDCDDGDDTVNPRQTETLNGIDDDCNGIVDDHTTGYDDDGDGQTEVDGDCDDEDGTVFAGASQSWDGKDNDCDGIVDEGTAYYDDDGDGYAEIGGDCDDTTALVYPGASEVEDAQDNDCDGIVDEGTAAYDDDGDGYSEYEGDCDDSSTSIGPDATEDPSDTIDQDCDGVAQVDADGDGYISSATGGDDCLDTSAATHPYSAVNEADASGCYTDADDDGWGDDSPARGLPSGSDCDDGDGTVSPDALESCDGEDDNCDGEIDEEDADGCDDYYYDRDGDGYGSDSAGATCLCEADGYWTSAYDTDCYDSNSSASPAASSYKTTSRGDGSYDWNCDGTEDKYWKTAGAECSGFAFCTDSSGWTSSSAPKCGTSSTYQTSCEASVESWGVCTASTSTYTQKCI